MFEHHRPSRVLLCCALALLFVGCAARSAAKPSQGLERIVAKGVIRVGTSGEQPPLTMTARNGNLIGLDIALSRVLAQSMGVDAEFVKLPFGRLLPALESGDVDIVMSGMTINPSRSQRVTFVGPYYTSGKALLTRSEEIAAAGVAAELDSAELRVAALAGSTSEEFARRALGQTDLVFTEQLEEAIAMVIVGEVDLLIADRETCDFAVLRHPDAGLIAPPTTFTIEPMGIAVARDDPRLANLIQNFLTALGDAGALETARAFWFKDPSWVKDLR